MALNETPDKERIDNAVQKVYDMIAEIGDQEVSYFTSNGDYRYVDDDLREIVYLLIL